MAKSGGQKGRLLALREILLRQTDEEHGLTLAQLQGELEGRGLAAERKSLYDDIETLRLYGLDVMREGRRYFVAERPFQLPELKLLVDAVQACKFITRRKSDQLIGKVEGLCSAHQARQLQRQVYVSGRIKVMNESIYYNVDKLHTAISGQRAITFQYFDYDIHRKKVYRRDGKRYTVSPYGLIWNSENYYLVAYDHLHREMRHYRVDKMAEILVTSLPRQGQAQYPNFQLAQYGQKHFGMYSGQEMTVRLRGRRNMAGVVWDRFGQDVILVPDGEEHFTVTLPVVLSPQFFGWLFGLEGGLVPVAPKRAVLLYRQKLAEALENLPAENDM